MADLLSRITVNPAICHGQPTVRGLRYPVQNVLELLASGMTDNEMTGRILVYLLGFGTHKTIAP
jgi:uncharacterized protein (DUF433 family)